MTGPGPLTLPRIRPNRPLVICDADEVLFYFLRGLEAFMSREGLYLDLKSFAITGNIRRRETDVAIEGREVKELIERFFAAETANLQPVEGAAHGLARLKARADIVILSNLPAAQADLRRTALTQHGMDYPLITNSGPKGPIVRELTIGHAAPAIFIDDLPPNIHSVAAEAPHVHCIHFIADKRLSGLVPIAKGSRHRAADWQDLEGHVHSLLSDHGH